MSNIFRDHLLLDKVAFLTGGSSGMAGVRLNVISPGPIDDTEGMRRLTPTEETRQRAMLAVPLGRFGAKDEIADLALFLCSDAAQYITGAICVCDGGQSLVGSSGFIAALAPRK